MAETLPRIFCAIDTQDLAGARGLAGAMARAGCGLKLGLEFFNARGPEGVRAIRNACPDTPLFLDLKFHDIPNTVAQAVRAVVPLGLSYINVHASGGLAMMRAANEAAHDAAHKCGLPPPRVLAVTVLTSLDEAALARTGQAVPVGAQVQRLAWLTKEAGLAGIVCSAHEIAAVRAACGSDFVLMVPGIRPEGHEAGSDDQSRIMTPRAALAAGATHLVVGRPITKSPDAEAAARAIVNEIAGL